MTDFNHIDYTEELNRIITALTGIRDDIRLLRTLQEDPESGIVTNGVMNDFQRAVLAVSMSSAGSNTAAAVAAAVSAGTVSANGGGIADPSGDSNGDLTAERETILEALGQDPTTQKVLMRESGFYYWEAEPTAGPDDGLRGSVAQVTPFAKGELLGFDNQVSGQITAGSPSGPPDQIPNPSKPRKRWPFARPEGSTASQNANPNADLVDPATGVVVARSSEDQAAINKSGSTPPPAIDYTEPPAEEPPAEESQFPFIHPDDSAYNIHTFDTGDKRVDYVDRKERPFQLPASEGEFVNTRTNDQGGQIIIYVFQETDQIWFPYTIAMYEAESGEGVPFSNLDNIVRQPV